MGKCKLHSLNKSGFTLLELVVALALSVVLLSAIASAISLLWRTSTFGKETVAEAQLVRAIFRKIEVDLRSLSFDNPAEAKEAEDLLASTGDVAAAQVSENSTTITITNLEDETVGTNFGVIGGPDWLTFTVNETIDLTKLNTQATADEQNRSLTQPGSAFSLCSSKVLTYSTSLSRFAGTGLNATANQSGLSRRAQANCYGETEQIFKDQLIASEVNTIQFRYFDGQQWATSWDSREFYALPVAIEVRTTIAFYINPNGENDLSATSTQKSPAKEYRYVIALPMSFSQMHAEDEL